MEVPFAEIGAGEPPYCEVIPFPVYVADGCWYQMRETMTTWFDGRWAKPIDPRHLSRIPAKTTKLTNSKPGFVALPSAGDI
jgi:hypothetical protein